MFSSLQDVFQRTQTVHLQGWGESLLLDDIGWYIRLAKRSGCRVTFTSNGSLMDEDMAHSLVQSGVDGITFSMAGVSAALQDSLRGEHSFAHLESSLVLLAETKKRLHSSTPAIAVSYLLTPDTMPELARGVKWCGKRGVSVLVGVHLTHAADTFQQSLQLFSDTPRRYKGVIWRAHLQAFLSGVRLELPPLAPSVLPVCAKNPTSNLSIAADGSVAPCVFLNAPVARTVSWSGQEGNVGCTPFRFGSIAAESLDTIWNRKPYQEFRNIFAKRIAIYQKALAGVGYDLDGIEQLERAREDINRGFSRNRVPDPCTGCPKLQGY